MTSMHKVNKTNTSKINKVKQKSSSLKLRNLKYYLGETLRSIWRNKIMSISSMATVAACMTMVILSFAVTTNISFFLEDLERQVGIAIHIDDALTQEQVDTLGRQILDHDNVADITFVTPEQALENIALILGDETGILGTAFEYEANPLRRSFVAELENIRLQYDAIAHFQTLFGVAHIDASTEASEMLISVNNFVAFFGIAVVLVLGALSVVIITNTIKLTVNSRRNEIVIMKYVGATDAFIRWPFIIEGIMIGVIGGLVPLTIAMFGYERLVESITTSGSGLLYIIVGDFTFRTGGEIFPILAPVILVIGGAIGFLGSMSSMRKHLNV